MNHSECLALFEKVRVMYSAFLSLVFWKPNGERIRTIADKIVLLTNQKVQNPNEVYMPKPQ
jgi:hypothetical protein